MVPMNKLNTANLVPETIETIEQAIINSIVAAVSEQRLPAGTKLGEQILSEIFNCNRANVRRALSALATMHVVQLLPHRGAFIATPSPKEAGDVFEARRTIEKALAKSVIKNVRPQHITDMRAIISAEADARISGGRPAELRLSRVFHMQIAAIADNQVLERFLSELTLRTTLIIGLYNRYGSLHCAEDEHQKIVQAIEAREESLLIQLLEEHLNHLEASLDFQRASKPLFNLAELLTLTTLES